MIESPLRQRRGRPLAAAELPADRAKATND
jgi:hypothetical protein